jgi:hypothetical protein
MFQWCQGFLCFLTRARYRKIRIIPSRRKPTVVKLSGRLQGVFKKEPPSLAVAAGAGDAD